MKRILVVLLSASLFGATEASAQTTPTFGEKAIGSTTCKNGASAADFDTLAQCTSTSGTTGTMQKAPLFVGAVTSPPYAATTCDANKAGMIQYVGTNLQYCNGTSWTTIGTAGAGDLGTSATVTAPSRADDVTTGLFSNTASTISIATAGTERLRITATGSVGIGTTAPSSGLHLNSPVLNVAPSLVYHSKNAWSLETTGAELAGGVLTTAPWSYWLQVRNASSVALPLSINPLGGNVGIGTAAPTRKLSIDEQNAYISFNYGGTEKWVIGNQNVTGDLFILHSGGTNVLTALSDGNVNIPTTDSALSFGSDTRQMLNLYATSYGIGVQGSTLYSRTNGGFAWYKGGVHSDTQFNPGTGGTAQMVITSTGYVGIGTTSPGAKLTVSGAGTWADGFRTEYSGGGGNGWNLTAGSDNNLYIGYGSATSAAQNMFINTSGNVGIGTTNPGYKLHVAGTLGVDSNATVAGGVTVGGYPDFNYGEIEIQGVQNTKAPFVRFHRPNEEYGQIRYGTDAAYDGTFYFRNINAGTAANVKYGTGMVAGWPDAIRCTVDGNVTILYATLMPWTGNGNYYYRVITGTSGLNSIIFSPSGAFAGYQNITSSDCNVSISTLVSSGKAFLIARPM